MRDHIVNWMRANKVLTGDPGLDRRTYISLAFCGDISPDEIPLDAELEAELPFEFRQVRPLHEN
jgi:hypothetical protein